MAGYIPDQQPNTGSNLPTTQVWSVGEIYAAQLEPKLEELFLRLYQNLGLMSDSVNKKEFGFYLEEVLVNGKVYYNPTTSNAGFYNPNDEMNLRPNFRTVVRFPSVQVGANTQAHGLTIGATWQFTEIHGVANSFTNNAYYPLLYGDSATAGITILVNATNVVITNNTAITFELPTDVTLEWCQY